MKRIVYVSILALSLLMGFATAHSNAARMGGPSAEGSLKFSTKDGLTKYLEFKAAADEDGTTNGAMTFSGPEVFPEQDVDGEGRKGFSGELSNLYIEAKFDGLLVEANRAVMSGTVTASNLGDYIGQRVLLVVEDNGSGVEAKEPDQVTWGLYKPLAPGWTPTDAELENDYGWKLTWTATDAELKDDIGVSSKKSTEITCQSFPLSSHDFAEVKYEDGDIQVRP
jgi:hypothetical protein